MAGASAASDTAAPAGALGRWRAGMKRLKPAAPREALLTFDDLAIELDQLARTYRNPHVRIGDTND